MTVQELADAKADLVAMKDALRRRISGKAISQVGSNNEMTAFATITVTELRDLIRETELKIRLSEPGGFGAIYIR